MCSSLKKSVSGAGSSRTTKVPPAVSAETTSTTLCWIVQSSSSPTSDSVSCP